MRPLILLCCLWASIATAATHPYRCTNVLPNAFRTFRFPLGNPGNGSGYEASRENPWLQFVGKESRVYSCGDQTRFFDAYHPAEDWNRINHQMDYGDTISAAGDGEVVYVENTRPESGWGRLMMIRHVGSLKIPDPHTGADTGEMIGEVWTLYGHMIPDGSDPLHANPLNPRTGEPWKACDVVKSGEAIGHLGHSREGDHLHFEVKSQIDKDFYPRFFPCRKELNWITSHYLYPTAFINLNRPRHEVSLASVPRESGVAPLEVDFITRVESNLEGETTFTLYCNRPDSDATVTPGWKFRTTTSANPLTHPELHCSYASPGVYTAKIVAEREGRAAEARRKITVTPPFCPALFGARAAGVECTTSTTTSSTTSTMSSTTTTSSSVTSSSLTSTTVATTTTVSTSTITAISTTVVVTTSTTNTTNVSPGASFRLWHDPLADGTIFPEGTKVVGCDIHAPIDHSSGETHCIRDLQIGGTIGLTESSNSILSVLPNGGFNQPITFTIVNVERDDNIDGVGDGASLVPLPFSTKFARLTRSSYTIQPAQYGGTLFQVQLVSSDVDGNAGRYIIHLRGTSEGLDPPVSADTYLLVVVGHQTVGFVGGVGGPGGET